MYWERVGLLISKLGFVFKFSSRNLLGILNRRYMSHSFDEKNLLSKGGRKRSSSFGSKFLKVSRISYHTAINYLSVSEEI